MSGELRRRLIVLGGVAVAAAVVVVVIVLVSGGGSSSAPPGGKGSGKVVREVSTLLAGIPQSGEDLGAASAPVTVLYFGDLECPACASFTDHGALSQLISGPVRSGQVRLEYHSFCTATCEGPGQSTFYTQQIASYAAGLQGRFWDFAELFYHQQGAEGSGYVTPAYLTALGKETPGLNAGVWQVERGEPSLRSDVTADEKIDQELHLQNTPTLVVQGPKRTVEIPSGSLPGFGEIQSAISQAS